MIDLFMDKQATNRSIDRRSNEPAEASSSSRQQCPFDWRDTMTMTQHMEHSSSRTGLRFADICQTIRIRCAKSKVVKSFSFSDLTAFERGPVFGEDLVYWEGCE